MGRSEARQKVIQIDNLLKKGNRYSPLIGKNKFIREKLPWGEVISSRGNCNDDDLKFLENFEDIKGLRLADTNISDQGIAQLEKLGLQYLNVSGTGITDNSLAIIGKMSKMQNLAINSCNNLSDRGLQHLTNLKVLERLSAESCNFSDSGLIFISKIKSLKTLAIGINREVTDEGLYYLQNSPNLKEIFARSTRISGKGVKFLAQNFDLKTLGLSNQNLSDADVVPLIKLRSLSRLHLANTRITDKGLKDIAKIESLKNLDIRGNQRVSLAGLKELKQLPNLRSLWINQIHFGAQGLYVLRSYPNLITLHYDRDRLNNSEIKAISRLNLRNLVISGRGLRAQDLTPIIRIKSLKTLTIRDFAGDKSKLTSMAKNQNSNCRVIVK